MIRFFYGKFGMHVLQNIKVLCKMYWKMELFTCDCNLTDAGIAEEIA